MSSNSTQLNSTQFHFSVVSALLESLERPGQTLFPLPWRFDCHTHIHHLCSLLTRHALLIIIMSNHSSPGQTRESPWTIYNSTYSWFKAWIKVPCTSAIRHKADQCEGNVHTTQDVIRAIWVLPGCSCAMSFAIEAMSKAVSMYVQTHSISVMGCVD